MGTASGGAPMADTLRHEKELWAQGYRAIAGVDEVGMGCLAGPVVAAAVIFPAQAPLPAGITDSKKLTPKMRDRLVPQIEAAAVAFALGSASVEEIDTINIFHAAKKAMQRAVAALRVPADYLLVDGKFPIPLELGQRCLIKGDTHSLSIGAASILAKVHRDRQMVDLDGQYPG